MLRELDLEINSIRESWAYLHGAAAPIDLCIELGALKGPAILDHRTHLRGDHLALAEAGTGRKSGGTIL